MGWEHAVEGCQAGIYKSRRGGSEVSYFLDLRICSIELDEREYEGVLEWSIEKNATYYDSIFVMASKKMGQPS